MNHALTTRALTQTSQVLAMTCLQWASVRANPIQRDTDARLEKALKYLKNDLPTHYTVNAGRYPDGSLVKLDGHTRGRLWELGKLPSDRYLLTVNVYPVADDAEAIRLYKTFDSQNSVEGALDRLSGAMRFTGFAPKSHLLRSKRGLTGAMNMLGETLMETALTEWQQELHWLDSLEPAEKRFPMAIIAACLVTARRNGSKVFPFWTAFARGEGWRNGKERDGVVELETLVQGSASLRSQRSTLQPRYVLAGRAISCSLSYLRNERYTQGCKVTNFHTYLKESQEFCMGAKRTVSSPIRP